MSFSSKAIRYTLSGFALGASTISVVYYATERRNHTLNFAAVPANSNVDDAVLHGSKHITNVLGPRTSEFKSSVEWDYNWDRRHPENLVNKTKYEKTEDYENQVKKRTPKATRHLIFIRHGQYEQDKSDDSERVLTQLGREQANFTGLRLAALDKKYLTLWNSTMTRAIETSDIIAKHLPDVPRATCDLLREGAPYPPQPPLRGWGSDSKYFAQGARIEAAFRKYVHRAGPDQEKDSTEIFVCHANVIRYFVCRALQLPPEAWLRMTLRNGSLTILSVRPSGSVGMLSVGDAGFMPPEKLSTS